MNKSATAQSCARELLDGVHSIMCFIRHEMRRRRQAGLTVPQFRALVYLSLNEDCTLSAIAEHVGLSLPAASRMVALLVKRSLIARETQADDRRRVSLSLTVRGRSVLSVARQGTQRAMARQFDPLSPRDRAMIVDAMRTLNRVFDEANRRNRGGAVSGKPVVRIRGGLI